MSKLQDLQDRKNELVKEVRTLGDSFNENGESWKDQEQENRWNELNASLNEVENDIREENKKQDVANRLKALNEQEERGQREAEKRQIPGFEDRAPNDGEDRSFGYDAPELQGLSEDEVRTEALAGWLAAGRGEASERQQAAMRELGVRANGDFDFRSKKSAQPVIGSHTRFVQGLQKVFRSSSERFREQALSQYLESRDVATSGSAGNLIPTTLASAMEINMLAFGGMRQVADMIVTSGGGDYDWPTADDTGNSGAILSEAGSIGASVDPTFSKLTLSAYKYSSTPILVSFEVLQDAIVANLPEILGGMLGERIGRITNDHFTTGTNSSQPNGLITAASAGVTAASATVFTADELIDLLHSVDPAYRGAPSVGWMFHDDVLAYIRKLKDSNNQYLWQPGMRVGEPDLLHGYRYTINQSMSNTFTTGQRLVAFGEMSKYKIRRAGAPRLRRLDERYADTDQVAFIAFVREDGDLLDAGTGPVKTLDLG